MVKSNQLFPDEKGESAQSRDARDTPMLPSDYFPILDGENKEDFAHFRRSCISALQPKDAIETVWIMDFILYTWEFKRLMGIKAALINSHRREGLAWLLDRHGKDIQNSNELAEEWSREVEDVVEFVNGILSARGLDNDAINLAAYQLCAAELMQLDQLISSYNCRRDSAMRELARYNDYSARRAKDQFDKILDAEFENLAKDKS